MRVQPGDNIIVPDVGVCKVVAQYENRRIVFESPAGTWFRMDVQDLVARIWTDFDRQIEQDHIGSSLEYNDAGK